MTEGLTNPHSGLVVLFLTVYWLARLVLRRRETRRKVAVLASSTILKYPAATR
jgi:hypothetical protein